MADESVESVTDPKGQHGGGGKASTLRALASRDVVLLDGALATELERRGASLPDKLWSAGLLVSPEGREAIRAVHASYAAAGADVAITASYQASIEGFATREQALECMAASVRLAREGVADAGAAGGLGLVAASVGPYGAALADGSEYNGSYATTMTEAALAEWHRPRIQALLEEGADLLAIETIPCLKEVAAICGLLRDCFPDALAWVSLCARDADSVHSGDSLAACAAAVERICPTQIVAVGVNCCAPGVVAGAMKSISSVAPAPERATRGVPRRLLAYPNTGEAWDAEARTWVEASEERDDAFAEMAVEWAVAGVSIFGGCCRTTPDTIKLLAAAKQGLAKACSDAHARASTTTTQVESTS